MEECKNNVAMGCQAVDIPHQEADIEDCMARRDLCKNVPPLRPTVHRDRAITTIEDDAAEDNDTAYTNSVNTESSSDSNEYGDGVGYEME